MGFRLMRLLWRYQRFLYQRLWKAGKYGSLAESRWQMVPWLTTSLALTGVFGFLDLESYSYQILAATFVVLSPMAAGTFIIYRVMWHINWKRIRLEPVIQNNDD